MYVSCVHSVVLIEVSVESDNSVFSSVATTCLLVFLCLHLFSPSFLSSSPPSSVFSDYNSFSTADERPTLPELLSFPTQSGSIDITSKVGMKYMKLGTLLLEDNDGPLCQPSNLNVASAYAWLSSQFSDY